MSAPAGEVDWDEAERRERRLDWLLVPGFVAFFGGLVLLSGGFAFLTGAAAWAVVGVLLAVILLMSAASQVVPRLRTRSAPAYRIQAALRLHADPGPELRGRADRQAQYLEGTAWLGWPVLLGPLGLLLGGQWNRPIAAAIGAVLVLGTACAVALWWRGRLQAVRRWLADPPGPPREVQPLPTRMRWLTGRRAPWIFLGAILAVGLIAGVLAVVVIRR